MPTWKFREPRTTAKKPCEICGQTQGITQLGIREYRLGLKQDVFVMNHQDVICPSCGFIYSLYIPDQAFLSNLYGQFYNPHFDYIDVAPSYDLEFRVHTIESHSKPGDSILEIGALDGFLSEPLERAGFKYSAIDPSNSEQESDNNLQILGGMPGNNKYSAIISYYVLEHVSNLRAWLSEVVDLLEPNGILILEVPNLISHPRASLSSLHFSHFTPFHLKYLLKDAGFEILSLTPDKASRDYGMCCVARSSDDLNQVKSVDAKGMLSRNPYQLALDTYKQEEHRQRKERQQLETSVQRIVGDLRDNISEIYLWPANNKSTVMAEIFTKISPHIKCHPVDDSPTRRGLYQDGFFEAIIDPKSIDLNGVPKAFVLCSDAWNNTIFDRMKKMNLGKHPTYNCNSGERFT